jgi:hypothetical protein
MIWIIFFLKVFLLASFLRIFRVGPIFALLPAMEVAGLTYNLSSRPYVFSSSQLLLELTLFVFACCIYFCVLHALKVSVISESLPLTRRNSRFFSYFLIAGSFVGIYVLGFLEAIRFGEGVRQTLSKEYGFFWLVVQFLLLLPSIWVFQQDRVSSLLVAIASSFVIFFMGSRGLAIVPLVLFFSVHGFTFRAVFTVSLLVGAIFFLYASARDVGAGSAILHEILFRFDGSWNFLFHLDSGELSHISEVDHAARILFGNVPSFIWEEKPEISSRILQASLEGTLPVKYSATNYTDFIVLGPLSLLFYVPIFLLLGLASRLPQNYRRALMPFVFLHLDFAFEGAAGAKFQSFSFFVIIFIFAYWSHRSFARA